MMLCKPLKRILLAKAMYTFLVQYCPGAYDECSGAGDCTQPMDLRFGADWSGLSEPSYRTKAWVWRRHLSNPNFPKRHKQLEYCTPSVGIRTKGVLNEPPRVFSQKRKKVSILAHVAPPELQQSIFMHSDALGTYAKIRDYIEQYLINKNVLEETARIPVWNH